MARSDKTAKSPAAPNGGLLPQNSNGPTHYGKHVDGAALRAMALSVRIVNVA